MVENFFLNSIAKRFHPSILNPQSSILLDQWLSTLALHPVDLSAGEKLKQTRNLAVQLNLLPWNTTVITVGGTNGKGSVVACLESILLKAGYRVGSFTSPHLFRFNERICINQNPVDSTFILDAFKQIQTLADAFFFNVSYFQYAFLAALLIFKSFHLDIVILEVGIGGRYDAVNIMDPDVSVIASVDLDHCEILGNDRETIGYDKAGIMRSNKPTIYGEFNPPKSLVDYAHKIQAKLYVFNRDFFVENHPATRNLSNSILLQNAASAMMALRCLPQSFLISENNMMDGLRAIRLEGRCQLIEHKNRKILFDVSHNPAATKQLANHIKTLNVCGQIYAIVGMMKDKDVSAALTVLFPVVNQWAVTALNSPRSASVDQLKNILKDKIVTAYKNVKDAFEESLQKSNKNDLIIIFGSFVLVGDLLMEIKNGNTN